MTLYKERRHLYVYIILEGENRLFLEVSTNINVSRKNILHACELCSYKNDYFKYSFFKDLLFNSYLSLIYYEKEIFRCRSTEIIRN